MSLSVARKRSNVLLKSPVVHIVVSRVRFALIFLGIMSTIATRDHSCNYSHRNDIHPRELTIVFSRPLKAQQNVISPSTSVESHSRDAEYVIRFPVEYHG